MYSKIPSLRILKHRFDLLAFCGSVKDLKHLESSDFLTPRHLGPSDKEVKEMLEFCGIPSIDHLIRDTIPANILDQSALEDNAVGDPISENQFLAQLRKSFAKNKTFKSYIGCGFYPNILPGVIQRNMLENPGWYTAYTPYQAQVAQGRLQSLLNYQTMVQQLTGLQCSNASLLDEASAGGEAFYMAYNLHNGQKKKLFIDEYVFTPTLEVIRTRARYIDAEIVVGRYKDFLSGAHKPEEFCGIIVQTPDSDGLLTDYSNFFKQLDELGHGIIKIVASDLLSLTISKNIASMGADICFGSSQRFGVQMGFGGPYSGFFAARQDFVRKLPGRIIGISKDMQENYALRMALQTRQQHIRREKATSNICTAQALLANVSAMYAVYHGPKGLRQIAFRINTIAQIAQRIFIDYGFSTISQTNQFCQYFDTITLIKCDALGLTKAFLKKQINIRMNDDTSVSLSFSEVSTHADLQQIIDIIAEFTGKPAKKITEYNLQRAPFGNNLSRGENFMKQSIFNEIHSQSQMLRYLRYLEEKDISLNRSMIPLGSCTMKLNATTQMASLTWPELNIHPFVPKQQPQGYIEIIERLRTWLKSITKFDEISFQPNSGATGQYAGLVTIKSYLKSIGQAHRNICLIPKSAHGTNPASAQLAGMKVVPIQVTNGKVDLNDFKIKAVKHKDELGALMITFPSTAGLYEETIHQIIDTVHQLGGQVYMDGANMNAQVGYTSPAYLGADVCHLNLHKTFAIPHGGGGPGMGPIGVKKHLAPFLPTHPYSTTYNIDAAGTISVSQYGSASILTISYAYIALLGKQGIRKSTAYAILNANYLMQRLKPYYDILYINENNKRCSHEFIIDINPLKKKTGISEEDIAKRLIDYGFHAPTMSFPVAGTLMVQPTQSEDKGQLDRFADAMINIRKEITTNPSILKNAPYNVGCMIKDKWQYSFTREQAAFPLPYIKKRGKYWPPIRRVQNPYGDRNLICACPDISTYLE